MDALTIFITAFVVGLSGAMMPGPLLTVTINETLRKGFWAGPTLMLGHAFLELLIIILLVLGLSYVLTDQVAGIIGLVGGGFLIWLGYNMIREIWRGNLNFDLNQEREQNLNSAGLFSSGILVSLANPYFLLWWVSIGLGYVVLSMEQGYSALGLFYLGHISADFFWYGLISFLLVKGKRVIKPKVYQGVILVCGAFLIFLGGQFIKTGIDIIL